MNLVFCGTPNFAVPTLEKLIAEGFSVRLVVTNPDERSGRGYEMKPPPVKRAAAGASLEVYQPAKLKEPQVVDYLSPIKPDAIVVVAYGHILPQWLIDLPRLGCVNLHASLLPKYRGAAPIQWALIRGESVTGIATMQIDAGLDTGDLLLTREVSIFDDDTAESLSERLAILGADLMVETLRGLETGQVRPIAQDHARATLAPILKKEDGRIDWSQPATAIWNRVRGLRPWPGAYTNLGGKRLHVWTACRPVAGDASTLACGTLIVEHGTLRVACGEGTILEPVEVQLEGRNRLAVREFLNGVRIPSGARFE
jgi:methionyl-tRNA formyltransferase